MTLNVCKFWLFLYYAVYNFLYFWNKSNKFRINDLIKKIKQLKNLAKSERKASLFLKSTFFEQNYVYACSGFSFQRKEKNMPKCRSYESN